MNEVMVGIVLLVPSLILRGDTWLDASSWCLDSSGEVEIPMLISFSLVELVQYIVPLYPTISGKWQVVSDFSCCYGDLWGVELKAHSPVLQLSLLRRGSDFVYGSVVRGANLWIP
ncbi:hypothetical protein GIB67_035015 [Kingdonia uniflora]|uniref:Secreted protein n=1 Tax=Kingdonia uniflora TaxID=39325 RepID=A0A7J7L1F2_9MAGN|nr:hypothetical protein GIB67_035015 [Kingdonia uniflora]